MLFDLNTVKRYNGLHLFNNIPPAESERIILSFDDTETVLDNTPQYKPKYKQTFVNTELRYHMLQYRFKGSDTVHKELFVAGNADCRLFNTMGEQVESFLEHHKSKFDYISASNNGNRYTNDNDGFGLDTIPYDNHKYTAKEIPNKYNKKYLTSFIAKQDNHLFISKQTKCVCPDTGIEFYVNMPCPLGVNMLITHPFALYDNVEKFIKTYQKTGTPISGLDNSVLAGMLITVMRYKDFAYCKDTTVTNQKVSKINRRTLTYALNYFFKAHTRTHNPQFNLDNVTAYNGTFEITSFIKICKGEDDSIQSHYMSEKKYNTVKAKVYANSDDAETVALKKDVKACRDLLAQLQKVKPVSKQLYNAIELRIKGIGYLTNDGKAKLTDDVYSLFGENDTTRAFYFIVLSNQTDSIGKELLSFSQEIAKDAQDDSLPKPKTKIDFKALMGFK